MSAAADTVVACCQLAPQLGELERNRAASCAAIVAAADAGARVVVLPELAVSGYVFAGTEEARALAEPVDGPTVSAWAALARERDLVVVGGLCERDGDVLRNSAVLIDAGGLRAVYRKAHLWDREAQVFAAGSAAPPVVETAVGRIGIVVCYDLEFPEWVRLPALAGADLLCAPVNWPAAPRPAGERPAEVVRVQAAAATNRMFIAACDRTGTERGVAWVGGSVIVDPDGFPLAGPAGPHDVTTLVARCRLGDARDKRLGERNDALADRRPELYGPLTATGPRA
ncbi:MAG: putative hydrolase [Conexibacter sp.]|nr:putative hydrolase [Conexibacter sp.]